MLSVLALAAGGPEPYESPDDEPAAPALEVAPDTAASGGPALDDVLEDGTDLQPGSEMTPSSALHPGSLQPPGP